MRLRLLIWSLFAACGAAFSAVSPAHGEEGLAFATRQRLIPGRMIDVQVVEHSTRSPLSRARVSVDRLDGWDGAFESRAGTAETDSTGRAVLEGHYERDRSGRPTSIPAVHVLTVHKPGYLTLTVIGRLIGHVTLYLKPSVPQPLVEISGETSGWELPREYDRVTGGLVFRPFRLSDVFRFELNHVISSLRDEIDVYGRRPIPSNVVMPAQDVFFPAGGARVDKPGYRIPVPDGKSFRLGVAQAEGRVQSLISEVDFRRGGKVRPEILNRMVLTRMGLGSARLPREGDRETLTLDVPLAPRYELVSPQPPFESQVFAAPVADAEGDWRYLFPTDAKLLTPGRPMVLRAPIQGQWPVRALLAVAASAGGRRDSGIVMLNPGRKVSSGPFLEPDSVPDFEALPDHIEMKSVPRGIAFGAFSRQSRTPGRTLGQQDWLVILLPSAGTVKIPTGRLPTRLSIDEVSLGKLEFSGDFDERRIDADTQLRLLARFTYAFGRRSRP